MTQADACVFSRQVFVWAELKGEQGESHRAVDRWRVSTAGRFLGPRHLTQWFQLFEMLLAEPRAA